MAGRRQFSGFRDRTVVANFYRHFTRPTLRDQALNGYDPKTRRVPIVQLYDDSGNPIKGSLGTIAVADLETFDTDNKRPVADVELVILPADAYAPNLQDLGFNTYYEYVVYPRTTVVGLTETDILRYQNTQETLAEYVELHIDRIINDPGGYQVFFANTLSKPQ